MKDLFLQKKIHTLELLDIITSDNNIETIYELLSDYQFSYLHEDD